MAPRTHLDPLLQGQETSVFYCAHPGPGRDPVQCE